MTDALDPETRDRLLADPGAILADRDPVSYTHLTLPTTPYV